MDSFPIQPIASTATESIEILQRYLVSAGSDPYAPVWLRFVSSVEYVAALNLLGMQIQGSYENPRPNPKWRGTAYQW